MTSRMFGTSLQDFRQLAAALAWDLPGGLLLVNLNRNRTLMFSGSQAYVPTIVSITQALEWMRFTVGMWGCVVKTTGKDITTILFAVVDYVEHAEEHLDVREELIMNEASSWSQCG